MTAITTDVAFSDYNTLGVPASGVKRPKKSEIREWANSFGVHLEAEIPVSSTTVLNNTTDMGYSYVLDGAGLTLTLPSALSALHSYVFIRINATATGLFTIASDSIDGVASRVMWRTETALLFATEAGWVKVSGKTVPFSGFLTRSTQQSISASDTPIVFDTVGGDFTFLGLFFDNNRGGSSGAIKIPRRGFYSFIGYGGISQSTSGEMVLHHQIDGSEGSEKVATTDSSFNAQLNFASSFNADSLVTLAASGAGTSPVVLAGAKLALIECPGW